MEPSSVHRIRIQNFRAIASVDFAPSAVNVFFGPNGMSPASIDRAYAANSSQS